MSLYGALLPKSSIPKVKPSFPTYFFQQSVDPASIDTFNLVSSRIFFLYNLDFVSKLIQKDIDANKYCGTNLVQVNLVLDAITRSYF